MNFSEAIAEVLLITARPDRATEIASAINAAISTCSARASFAKDLVESSIAIDPNVFGDTIPFNNVSPTALVERFRKFKYVKAAGVMEYLTPIGADKIFTPGAVTQLGVYYVGGNNLTYTLKAKAASLEIGYYQYPVTLDSITNTNHWMLDLMPWTIIDLACARIFRSIGDDTSSRAYESTSNESFKVHRRDHEDSVLITGR